MVSAAVRDYYLFVSPQSTQVNRHNGPCPWHMSPCTPCPHRHSRHTSQCGVSTASRSWCVGRRVLPTRRHPRSDSVALLLSLCLSRAHISILFFFLMIRPPPRSPLFPYTTLSR